PAIARIGMIMKNRPRSMATPKLELYQSVLVLSPPKADPLLPTDDVYAYRICDSPCAPGLVILDVPNFATTAIAEKIRMVSEVTSMVSTAIFTSNASIFFPRYSGVRPTINPAMKTERITNTSIPYIPAPTPPKITSLSMRLIRGTIPPSGVNESCIELTAPQLVSVVTVAKSAEFATPKRTSFPSRLPAACTAEDGVDEECEPCCAAAASKGFPRASAQYAVVTPARNNKAIAAHTAHPWRGEPVIVPNV